MEYVGNSIAGGVLIGVSATGMMWFLGRVAGISGILGGLISNRSGDIGWRISFLIGLLVGGLLWMLFADFQFTPIADRQLWELGVGGLFVGAGTILGNGCTSGHGVCGVGRLSKRSLVATPIFIFSGMLTVFFLMG